MKAAETLTEFYTTFPHLVKEMKEAEHGFWDNGIYHPNSYHMEGDVWAHTMMVLCEAEKYINDYNTDVDPLELYVACLCHDLGKPFMRDIKKDEDGNIIKVRFIGHDFVSSYVAVPVVRHFFPRQVETQERILKVVGLHTQIFMAKDDTEFFGANEEKGHKLWVVLSRCDHLGRIHAETGKDAELNRKHTTNNALDPIQHGDNVLHLMVGVPGCGKSTLSGIIGDNIFSNDDTLLYLAKEEGIENYNEAFEWSFNNKINHVGITKKLMFDELKARKNEKNCHIIYDATNTSHKKRNGLFVQAKQHGFKVKIHVVIRTWSECVKCRSSNYKKIDLSVYRNMFSSFTWPRLGTFNEEEIHIV